MTEINKYNTGKIYKIWSPSRDDLIYYGSTIEKLCKRLSGHKNNYKMYKAGKGYNCRSFKIFDVCDDYRIDLIENYPCNSKEELNSKEGEYIKNNMCVNKQVAGRTQKEYRIEHREEAKQYRQANKEKAKEYRKNHKEEAKQYRQANKEKAKECYEANKDKIKEKIKQYREANKDRINARRRELRKLKKISNTLI